MREQSRSAGLHVVFAGGGTGGHFTPAVAVAEELAEMVPAAKFLFLTTGKRDDTFCRTILRGCRTRPIASARWTGSLQKFKFAAVSVAAAFQVLEVLRSFQPDVLIGLGGYGCVVPVAMARLLNTPTMLFESNAIPGKVVRALAPLVDCLQVQWERGAEKLKAGRVMVTGNPVRRRIFQGRRADALRSFNLAPSKVTLLACGGSQGALPLNAILLGALRVLPTDPRRLQVLHLTGPEHLSKVRCAWLPPSLCYRAVGFLEEMELAYAAADFVLSRAGGAALAELTALGLPSILVPYPYAAEGHQQANARVISDAGAAFYEEQARLSPRKLAHLIAELVERPGLRAEMSARCRALGRPHAARAVAVAVAGLAGIDLRTHTISSGKRVFASFSSRAA